MRKVWAWLGYQSGRRAGVVSIIGLLVTVGFGLGMLNLKFKTDNSSYLNKSDKVYKDDVRYERLFGGQAMVAMFTMQHGKTVADLFTPANLAKFQQLSEKLKANRKLVSALVSPTDAIGYSLILATTAPDGKPTKDPTASTAGKALVAANAAAGSGPAAGTRQKDFGITASRTLAALKNDDPTASQTSRLGNRDVVDFLLFNNTCYPQGGKFLTAPSAPNGAKPCDPGNVSGSGHNSIRLPLQTFFPNPTHAQLIVRLAGNQSIEDQGRSADFVTHTVSRYRFDNVDESASTTVGAPSLLKNINDYLKGGMFALGGLAALVMVVILLVLFRVRWRLLPLAVILVGLVWAFGLAGFLGIPLTLATIAGLPTLMGVGIDYAIQMHARVEEEVTISHHPHPIQETARNLCPALLVVTFDAVFAFCALTFAKVPMIRQFGILLAVGIAMICLCSIVAPLASLGIREFKSPTKRRDSGENVLGRMVVKMGNLPARAALPLAAASLLIFFGGVVVEGRLQLQTDPIQWVNPRSTVIHDIHRLQDGTGSSNEMGVFVRSKDVFADKTISYVDRFTNTELRRNPDKLATATSAVTVLSDLVNDYVRNPDGDVVRSNHVTPSGSLVKASYELAPPGLKKQLAAHQHGGVAGPNALNIIFRTATPNLQKVKGAVDEVRSLTTDSPDVKAIKAPAGVSITPSGLAVVGVGLLENLESNRILLTYLAIIFVAVFLALRMLSVARSLLSMVPVLIATGAASLIAFAFSLKLSPMTAVGGPLVVAACTEFTSLILLRFVEERARDLDPKEAMDVAAARTGRAFIVSALTAISGIAVISFSSMPLLRGFGIVIGMNVAVALLAALVVLPPMLVWADSGGRNLVSRGMVDRLKRARAREAAEDAQAWGEGRVAAEPKLPASVGAGGGGDGASDGPASGDGGAGFSDGYRQQLLARYEATDEAARQELLEREGVDRETIESWRRS